MPQLSAIFNNFTSQGFFVLAVPSNSFDQARPRNELAYPADVELPCRSLQEPYTNAELIQYAANNSYLFPFVAKTNVNGACTLEKNTTMAIQCGLASAACCPENANMYSYLKSVLPGIITWNYAKFLVGRDGCVAFPLSPSARAHFASTTTVHSRSVPIKRYSPNEAPDSIIPDIIKALAA